MSPAERIVNRARLHACGGARGCYPAGMTDERLILAIGRIERALSRLEAARLAPAAPALDPALATRHAALRACTAEAIARIDALLGAAVLEQAEPVAAVGEPA